MNKVELLAPAGNREKLEIAIEYGADAVYMSGSDFSLRNYAGNFTDDELIDAVRYTHDRAKKAYITCNIYPRNHEIDKIRSFLETVGKSGADGIIISDPGIILDAIEIIPHVPIHLSTQANTTNYRNVQFWEKMGVSRINAARELNLREISEITKKVSAEVEVFVHGAMCISYSGRCLLSSFMANRDSNRGLCCHPCRWKYSVVEEMRPGEYHPVDEDSRGTYIFNSRDICMIAHIPEIIEAGVISLKIEGRMKGINYLAPVVKTYRDAIDSYYENPGAFSVKSEWTEELETVNSRGYSTGFYLEKETEVAPNISNEKGKAEFLFVGKVASETNNGLTPVYVRNKICIGDRLEVICPDKKTTSDTVSEIIREDGSKVEVVQNGTKAMLKLEDTYVKNSLVRKRIQGV